MSETKRIDKASSSDPFLRELLLSHPHVDEVCIGTSTGIEFSQGTWHRELSIGDVTADLYGLNEIVDNNPIVCADRVSVPSPAVTLALIALAPLVQAGIMVDSPVFICNEPIDEDELHAGLSMLGWTEGCASSHVPLDAGDVLVATAMVAVIGTVEPDEILALFAERYDRTFFVRNDRSSEWRSELVSGQSHAVYRVGISPDSESSMVTIRVMGDRVGKCGAGQIMHTLNVMCGYEESLAVSFGVS